MIPAPKFRSGIKGSLLNLLTKHPPEHLFRTYLILLIVFHTCLLLLFIHDSKLILLQNQFLALYTYILIFYCHFYSINFFSIIIEQDLNSPQGEEQIQKKHNHPKTPSTT